MGSRIIINDHVPTFIVEARAIKCLQAVQIRLDLGLSKVVIEGDNLSVIKKLHAGVIGISVLSAYIIDAKKTSEDLLDVCLGM
ncbi:hypothetical protein PVK06_029209 [Gossypium arboreum]|uniref:RNase H type-1 domain-containing protein n=1 Tax=Gossypium arboreum TaxID=29729 RepID=A0ABR0P625_GOSAR|nr:hypothetical protein PVK06_029209 [Gossypium arboreum]